MGGRTTLVVRLRERESAVGEMHNARSVQRRTMDQQTDEGGERTTSVVCSLVSIRSRHCTRDSPFRCRDQRGHPSRDVNERESGRTCYEQETAIREAQDLIENDANGSCEKPQPSDTR